MKKIALYVPSLSGGGAERVMLSLANALAENGFKIDLVLNKYQGPYISDISHKVNVVELNTSRVLTSIIPLALYIRKEKPETIISAMNYINIATILAKIISFEKVKLVISEHTDISSSMKHNPKLLKDYVLKKLMRLTYKRADTIVAVSDGVASTLSNLLSVDKNHIKTIYNPVITEKLLIQKDEYLDHPWVKNKIPYIIGVGRLDNLKNFSCLIDAFATVRKSVNINLIILGEGPLKDTLESQVQNLGLSDYVQLPGFSNNPYAWIKNSECFVLSSLCEGLPTVLIEAMACGVPVVSTDCPSGPKEILENGRWGRLVPINDSDALAEAILKTLNDTQFRPELIEKKATDFSVENALKDYLKIII